MSVPARITTEPIDSAALLEQLTSGSDGAVLLFLGVVRDRNDGRAVSGIRYEAYAEMAESVLAEIVAEAERAAGARVAAVHRIGELAVGEASVAIAVASAHRAAAYEASRFVIEEIKRRLPVWKHEQYADGQAEWLDGAIPEARHAR